MRNSIRRSVPGFLAILGVLGGGLLIAEVDRLKPGKGVEAEKPHDHEGEAGGHDEKEISPDEHDAIHRKLAEESEANLKEIARLMEKVRDNLAQKQTGGSTQGEQREVVKKLQELIDKVGKGCGSSSCGQSGGSSGGQSSQEKQSAGQKKKQSGSEKQRAENEKQLTKQGQEKSGKKNEPKSSGKVPNDRRELGKLPPSKSASLAEKAEILERWGLLPKRVVEQMRNSTGKEYPSEYKEIISRYYEKLSEMVEQTTEQK